MNYRKDIYEKVKYMLKEDPTKRINCSKLARQFNCDRRTIKSHIEAVQNGLNIGLREYPKKTDGFENKIEEKVAAGAPAIAIYDFLHEECGYSGSYSTIKSFVHNLNHQKQSEAVIRFETNPGLQAQVDWKESLKFKTKNGGMIKFNVFLLILGFSRTKFIMVTESRDLNQVECCLTKAFEYIGGVPREILFDNMRSIIDKARTQYNDPVFNEKFSAFAAEAGFVPKACVAYRPETKGKIEVVAKLMNRLKVYSGEIENFEDVCRITERLNYKINHEICQSTGYAPYELLPLEQPELLTVNLELLQDFTGNQVSRLVNQESMISYEGVKYSVPIKYIGKRVNIVDSGDTFDISFDGILIRTWNKSVKKMNFNHDDYLEIARNSSLRRLNDNDIVSIAERNLEIYDKL